MIFIGLTTSIGFLNKSINQLRFQTAIKENALREMSHLANHDSLTGLPNRHLVIDLLTKALQRAKRDNTKLLMNIAAMAMINIVFTSILIPRLFYEERFLSTQLNKPR